MPFSTFVRALFFALLLVPLSSPAATANLTVKLSGTNDRQASNILAHLGKLPETQPHRNSFIFNAKTAATKAMAALGYYHPDITQKVDKQQEPWLLTLKIKRGPSTVWKTVNLEVIGEAGQLTEFQSIANEMGLLEGKRIQHDHYEKAKTALISRGLQMGFFDGRLTQSRLEIDREKNTANALLTYQSGSRYSFGKVTFQGGDLQPELLQNILPFEQGMPYDINHINRLNRELTLTGYFSSVKVQPLIDKRGKGQIPVLIELIPAKSHRINLGVGYTTDTRERASITWRTPQINEYGHSQETKIEFSEINPYIRFIYDIPLSHPNDDVLQLQMGLENNDYADISSDMRHARVGRRQNKKGWILQYYVRFLDERWDILEDSWSSEFFLPGITLANTRRDGNLVDPDSGFRQLYAFEVASEDFLSESDIIRAVAKFTWVKRVWKNHRWVLRSDLGASYFHDRLLDDVPPSLRFYAGGDGSIRGFSYHSLGPSLTYTDDEGNQQKITTGGRYLAVGSIEHQYYLNEAWRIAVFTDFGNAYADLEDLDPAYSVGTGVHWLSVVGPIKLEVARSLSEDSPSWRFHINIGAEL